MTTQIITSASKPTPVDDLVGYFRNPRRGDVELIKDSLDTLGQYKAIVVNDGSKTGRPNEVLAGNHTLMAARELGWRMIDAQFVDVDDATARKIVLVDNRSNDQASYDNEILSELLAELEGDVGGTGWSVEAIEDILMLSQVKDLDELADEVGDPQEEDHWPTLAIKVSPETEARWRRYVDKFDGSDDLALADLLP